MIELVRGSKFAIHDISRCKSSEPNQFMRLNMPFELGIDFACRIFGDGDRTAKSILVLEAVKYDYQKALSDIAGWDIQPHASDPVIAVRLVISWLIRSAGADRIGPARVDSDYVTFQEWYYERELASGASDEDIRAFPNVQVIEAMREWVDAGRPVSFGP